MNEARQTPLPDLLDQVPEDIVLGIPGDEPVFPSYTNIPIGKHARQAAAAELRRLSAENKRLHQRHHDDNVEYTRALAQRDALLEALKDVVAFTGAHGGPYAQARAAIKAVEENT